MNLIISISREQNISDKKDQYYKAHSIHNILKSIDNKIVSSVDFYSILRCLREDILQLDQYYKCETILDVHWVQDKSLHVINISTRFYSATITAKQID